MALGLAVYASPPALPLSTQDSLLTVGQTLSDGLHTRRVTIKGFRFQFTSLSSPFAKLLGAIPFVFYDHSLRKMENLELYSETIGTLPEQVIVEEHGAKFAVDLKDGQKTGWFYDQRDNRAALFPLVKGKTVIDVCSYVGAWGIGAAVAGASQVICVDASESALEQVAINAKLNDVEGKVIAAHGDAFDLLKSLRADKHHSDIVVLDPPAFIKRKKDLRNGTEAYTRLMRRGLQLVNDDGILVTCSCSFHMPRDLLVQRMSQAGRDVERSLQMFREGRQGPDHPIHPAMPETEYLKVLYARVLGRI